jgi:hypothetical protein
MAFVKDGQNHPIVAYAAPPLHCEVFIETDRPRLGSLDGAVASEGPRRVPIEW